MDIWVPIFNQRYEWNGNFFILRIWKYRVILPSQELRGFFLRVNVRVNKMIKEFFLLWRLLYWLSVNFLDAEVARFSERNREKDITR